MEKRSCAARIPAGGRGKGAALRTEDSAACARRVLHVELAMRAARRPPEGEREKAITTRHLPEPRGR